jgi:hypothetical protein
VISPSEDDDEEEGVELRSWHAVKDAMLFLSQSLLADKDPISRYPLWWLLIYRFGNFKYTIGENSNKTFFIFLLKQWMTLIISFRIYCSGLIEAVA